MVLGSARHQMPGELTSEPGRRETASGEAASRVRSDEARPARRGNDSSGAGDLLGQALARHNMVAAWKRVKANKGSAGVDGRDVQATGEYLKQAWESIRRQLLDGSYRPAPVRRVALPKPDGGTRELGIPTVVDRLIQQALLQVLQPILDPTFSEHSHGFRPGRSAHGAVRQAQQYVRSGYTTVVDVDLAKFFDRVNHDILMDRLARRIADKAVLRLIRRYLQAGAMADGLVSQRTEGTPQGGPLSPLLANVLLDEVDRELERRGHRFVRYADDCNVYVKSQQAGERVLRALRKCYARLRLEVNQAKTAVAEAWNRKFLGYRLWRTREGDAALGVSKQAMVRVRDRIRGLTGRLRGRSLEQIAQQLREQLQGWAAYYSLARDHLDLRRLEGWMRRRLRALQLKQWRQAPTVYREMRALGAAHDQAVKMAGSVGRWWRASRGAIQQVLTVAYFDRLGVPRLC
jgi:RNA-directed DNA polymerase